MITDIEKKECDKFYLPNGLYYKLQKDTLQNRIKNLDNDFENISQYATALKNLIHSNGLRFFYEIKDLDRVKFIDAINVQFDYYSETEQNMYGWLNLTYDLIIKGFSIAGTVDIEKQSDFKKWFNEKIETKKYYEYEIVSHIIGQRNNMNSPKTLQPCYHYIKDVLSKYQLNSIKAKEMVNDFKGSFSPDWNKNVIPFIIDYLGSINVTSELQQSNSLPLNTDKYESTEPKNKYPKIFKNGYAYQMFIELKNLTVDKNHLADYGFIYYKLFDKKVGAINDNITHPKFINFLVKEFDADIVAKKFTFKNQQNKQQAYNTTLEKYKANIID